MKHRTIIILAAAAAALLLVGGAFAAAQKSAKVFVFTGKYKGTATTKVTDNVADIVATGAGTGSFIGAGKITGVGKGDTTQQPCVPFTGPGKITGTSGTITFTVVPTSKGCGDEAGQVFSISGKVTVTKATGKLAKAKGTLKMTGVYDKGAGTFNVTFKGNLNR